AMAAAFVEGFHAAPVDQVSVNGLIKINEATEEIDGDRSFRVTDGYDQIMTHLHDDAAKHRVRFHLNSIVKEIKWTARQVHVASETEAATNVFSGDAALITVPLGVLQAGSNEVAALRFVPELPKKKQSAINTLRMGQAIKITLLFREPFWEKLKS